jgi:hypothetical protein
MFEEEELIIKFKNNPYYKEAISRLDKNEADQVEKNVENIYRKMIQSLMPLLVKCNTNPEFLKDMNLELNKQYDIINNKKE